MSKHRSHRLSDGHIAKMVLCFSAVSRFSWYTAHNVSRVDEGLRRRDASNRLLKSRLNRQRVSSPSTTHTHRQHSLYKDQQPNIITMNMSHGCELPRLGPEAEKKKYVQHSPNSTVPSTNHRKKMQSDLFSYRK